MFGLDDVLGGLSLVGSIGGVLDGRRQAAQAKAAREAALANLGGTLDREYQDLRGNNLQAMRTAEGYQHAANSNFASNLGSDMARAGVFNSTGTAGAVAANANAGQAQIADMGQHNFANEQGILNANKMQFGQMALGQANQDYGQALGQQQAGLNGLGSFLSSMSNYNLKRMSVPNSRGMVSGGNGFGATDPGKMGLDSGSNPFAVTGGNTGAPGSLSGGFGAGFGGGPGGFGGGLGGSPLTAPAGGMVPMGAGAMGAGNGVDWSKYNGYKSLFGGS